MIDPQIKYISNFLSESAEISSDRMMLNNIIKLVSFRYMPHILKDKFQIYSGVFEELKFMQGSEAYVVDSNLPYKKLKEPLTFDSNQNCFRLYHLFGAHEPYTLNENGEDSGGVTDLNSQIKGSLKMVLNYIDQLKAQGVYDNSTIIIMADHGNVGISQNPLFMIKGKHTDSEFKISAAPISYEEILPTFMNILGENYSDYGRTVFEIDENEKRTRYFYRDIHTSEVRHIAEYVSTGPASDVTAWKETGTIYYGDAAPTAEAQSYLLGTSLSFLEDATANRYTKDGFTRINDMYTITTGTAAEMRFKIKDKISHDLTIQLNVSKACEGGHMIIQANGQEVFNEKNIDGEIQFNVSKEGIKKDSELVLNFEFPDAEDSGWHMSAFRFLDMVIF